MHMGAAHLIPCQLLVLLPGPSGHALVCALLCDKVEQAIVTSVITDVMTSCIFIVFILSLSVCGSCYWFSIDGSNAQLTFSDSKFV